MEFNEAFPSSGGTTGRSLVLFEEGASEAGLQAVAGGRRRAGGRGERRGGHARGGRRLSSSSRSAWRSSTPRPTRSCRRRAAPRSSRSSPSGSSTRWRRPSPRPRRRTGMRGSRRRPHLRRPWRSRRRAAGCSADYLLGYREAVLHLTDAVAAPGSAAAVAAADRRRRRVPGDLGAAGDEGRQLLPHRRGHPRGGARHRLRPPASRLRGTLRHHAVVRHRPGGPGRARARHALHRHRAWARSAPACGRATGSPTRPRSSRARCSRTPARARTPGSWRGSSGRCRTSAP